MIDLQELELLRSLSLKSKQDFLKLALQYVKDKDYPIADRWKFFVDNEIGVIKPWVENFKSFQKFGSKSGNAIEDHFYADGESYGRGQTIYFNDWVNELYEKTYKLNPEVDINDNIPFEEKWIETGYEYIGKEFMVGCGDSYHESQTRFNPEIHFKATNDSKYFKLKSDYKKVTLTEDDIHNFMEECIAKNMLGCTYDW